MAVIVCKRWSWAWWMRFSLVFTVYAFGLLVAIWLGEHGWGPVVREMLAVCVPVVPVVGLAAGLVWWLCWRFK